jgi:molybdopterin-guanine dinucleotide biosynthesis protein A
MGFDKTVVSVGGVPCAVRAAGVMMAVLSPVVEVGPGRSSLSAVREEPAGAGPLAAISAGFAHLRERFGFDGAVVVVAGDHPFVNEAALEMLVRFPGRASVVPVVAGRAQPLLARWSSEALLEAASLVAAGERSMHALVARDEVVLLEEADWPAGVEVRAFSDIDTPEDLVNLGLER